MDEGKTVIPFPNKPRSKRRTQEQSSPRSSVGKTEKFGVTPPGYILRLPKDLAGDFDKQCAACALLRTLTAVWLRRLRHDRRPLASRELSALLASAPRLGRGSKPLAIPSKIR